LGNLLTVFPLSLASFIRRTDDLEYARELVIGQWGMIPPWSKAHGPTNARGTGLSMVNSRTEGMEKSPTYEPYKDAWARGKRCIIPAVSFDAVIDISPATDPEVLGLRGHRGSTRGAKTQNVRETS
jgi:hypothetical protein